MAAVDAYPGLIPMPDRQHHQQQQLQQEGQPAPASFKGTTVATSSGTVRSWAPWSATEDLRLLEWCDARVSRAEVARWLGRTEGACSNRVGELRRRRRVSQAAATAGTAGREPGFVPLLRFRSGLGLGLGLALCSPSDPACLCEYEEN